MIPPPPLPHAVKFGGVLLNAQMVCSFLSSTSDSQYMFNDSHYLFQVRCVYCNGILLQWDISDVVEQEHHSHFPQCPFIQGENVGNIPLQPFTNGHSHANNLTSIPNPGVGSCNQFMLNRGYDIDPVEDRCGGSPRLGQPVLNGHHVSDAVAGLNNSTGDEISPRRIYSTSPRNPQMAVEPNRLATFKTWPAQIRQRPEQLARAGLYYTGE